MFNQAQEDFVQLKKVLAEGTSPVYLWIGAGLSQDAGFPSWSQLRENLINRGRKWLQPQFGLSTLDHKLKLLDVAEEDSNYWKAFDRICEAIGPTVYEQFIVSEFELASKCKIPKTYSGILGLKNIRGVITTNIDRLVTRTLGEICGMTPKEFTGFECGDYMHVLGQAEFFVLNLHGLVEKRSSWVMRKAELDSLMGNNAYNVFVQTLFSSGTVIFVGVNPIDEAVRVHLERTRNRSGMPGTLPLYWITDNTTDVAIDFENKYNIRRILYSADENHKELKEVVRLLNDGKSYDENLDPEFINVTPINKSVRNFDKLNFEKLSAEEARELLNKKASEILRSGDAEKYIKYEKFLNQYKRQIHTAWYVEPNEQLFGLTINNEIDEGAFGRVFQASDRKGNLHAVKVLKVDVMRKPEYLQSFRRGVRAMKILSDKNLPGIVKFEAASEIPALVQMELVDGENLYEAVKQRRVTTWREKMRILTDVGRIIKSAHALPERILHRDIRPQNINWVAD